MASYGDLEFATTSKERAIKGLEWPMMTSNTGGWCSSNYNAQAIKQGLMQLLLTSRGERPMRLDYGTTLRRAVFDELDGRTVKSLRESIQYAILKYEPRINVKSLLVQPSEDQSAINISLSFTIKGSALEAEKMDLIVSQSGVQING